jgi:hypothetical protein
MFLSAASKIPGLRRVLPLLAAALVSIGDAVIASETGGNPAAQSSGRSSVIVVVGAAGEEEFGENFKRWAGLWEQASRRAGAQHLTIGLLTNSPVPDRERLQMALANERKDGASEMWIVFLGHGTFDGKEAKFALRGPDISASELAAWLKPFQRPVAIIDSSSSSGPFLNKLSATNRVVISATRSGAEVNYARYGEYLSQAIANPDADLDKDGQTSLLEAFLMGARQLAEFYSTEGRLATEHPLLDDNGDGLGTPPDWFRGVRAVKSAKDGAPLDGLRAHQFHLIRSETDLKLPPEVRARRDALEISLAKLRDSKKQMPEDEYYATLEALLLEMARLYETAAPLKQGNTPPVAE